jgi:2-polyprenyl-6-methoxyphenol hydroxylase-like FAD-dependent oxidoreductase
MAGTARVLITGGGVGGLALAQALRHGGLDVAVYEQDPTPQIGNQGYRIHIDANGNDALRTCLPADVLDAVRRTSGIPNDLVAAYTHRLAPVLAQTFPPADGQITHVDRGALRQSLLTGLDDVVQFGRTVRGYQLTDSGAVRVEFAEGGSDEADLLVGADGARSVVRRQLLPHATVRDLGLRCIYGRMPIAETTEALIPHDFDRGFCWAADENECGAGFGPMRFRTRPEDASDYLMVTLVATTGRLGIPDETLWALSPHELWKLALQESAGWHPALRDLFAHADPETFLAIKLQAGERVDAWRSGPVTVLGDAVHLMPATGGVGASTALQDAATLATQVLSAARGEKTLIDAVSAYERVMLPRGFDHIDGALRNAAMMFGKAF